MSKDPQLFDAIDDLFLHGVVDAGIPNKERVVISALRDTIVHGAALLVGLQPAGSPKHLAFPMQDFFYRIVETPLKTGEWIHIYTGSGRDGEDTHPRLRNRILNCFWGRKNVIFIGAEMIPLLIQINGILVGSSSNHANLDAP